MAASNVTRPRNDLFAAKLAREKAPTIDPAEPEAIEEFLRNNGPCRRVATAFLSRVWRTSAKDIIEKREFAVAMAAEFLVLEESRWHYFRIAALMESAYERLREALHKRDDFAALLARAERERGQ